MKSKTTKYARILIAGSALMMTSAAFAEEEVVEPVMVICDFHPGITVDEKEITDDEIVIDESEAGDESEVDEEIVLDDEVIEEGEITDESDIVICWHPDWVKRTDEEDGSENPEYLYMSAGGPTPEPLNSDSESSAPEAADEQSAVTKVQAKTVTANIRRAAAKPTAVKSNGRVFLR